MSPIVAIGVQNRLVCPDVRRGHTRRFYTPFAAIGEIRVVCCDCKFRSSQRLLYKIVYVVCYQYSNHNASSPDNANYQLKNLTNTDYKILKTDAIWLKGT